MAHLNSLVIQYMFASGCECKLHEQRSEVTGSSVKPLDDSFDTASTDAVTVWPEEPEAMHIPAGSVSASLRMDRLLELFNSGNYLAVPDCLDKHPPPMGREDLCNVLLAICRFYSARLSMDPDSIDTAAARMTDCLSALDGDRSFENLSDRMREQAAHVVDACRNPGTLRYIVEMFITGLHHLRILRSSAFPATTPDTAALLFYRCIEWVLTCRLCGKYGSGTTGQPDYSCLEELIPDLPARMLETGAMLGVQLPDELPPRRLGVPSIALLLVLAGDEFASLLSLGEPAGMKRLLALSHIRNNSFLIHGAAKVSLEDCICLGKYSECAVSTLWQLHKVTDDSDFRTMMDRLGFVRLSVD